TRTRRGSGTALAESPVDSDLLYVGSDDGAFLVTTDGGKSWTKIVDFPLTDAEKKLDAQQEESETGGGGGEAAGGASAEANDRSEWPAGSDKPAAEAAPGEPPQREAPAASGERAERPERGEGGGSRGQFGGRMMERLMQLDANGDGKIQKEEVPERMMRMF